ncbi:MULTISPECIES: hypothetical protein [Novosphingobium]
MVFRSTSAVPYGHVAVVHEIVDARQCCSTMPTGPGPE